MSWVQLAMKTEGPKFNKALTSRMIAENLERQGFLEYVLQEAKIKPAGRHRLQLPGDKENRYAFFEKDERNEPPTFLEVRPLKKAER